MKYSSRDLKSLARKQLTGKYSIYISAYVVYLLITNIAGMLLNLITGNLTSVQGIANLLESKNFSPLIIYFIITLILGLILSVLSLGFNKMFLDGSRGYQIRFSDLFYGFRHHPDRVILMQMIIELISVTCCLPGFICILYGAYAEGPAPLILGVLLLIPGLVVLIYISLAFSQAMYLMADYDDIGPVQALKESNRMMKGHKGRLFYIQLSFIGITLLGLISCYIGTLWVFPYTSMTYADFYRNLGGEI